MPDVVPFPKPMSGPRLYGRDALMHGLMAELEAGCTVFGLEGVTGIGKSAIGEQLAVTEQARNGTVGVVIDLADVPSETLLIAALHERLSAVPRSAEQDIERTASAVAAASYGIARKLLGAAAKDLVKLANDKFENIGGVIGDLIAGEDAPDGVAAELEKTGSANQRMFIRGYMKLVADLGSTVMLMLDNYEAAEPSAQEFVNYLVDVKPATWLLVMINNIEKPAEGNWAGKIRPLIGAKAGVLVPIPDLDERAVVEWYRDVVGAEPAYGEAAQLIANSGRGRPFQLKPLIMARRDGTAVGRLADFSHLQTARRAERSDDARRVAELMTIVPADKALSLRWLEAAAQEDGVTSFATSIDELTMANEIQTRNGTAAFVHGGYRDSWNGSVGDVRRETIVKVWYGAWRSLQADGGSIAGTGLLPALARQLATHEPADTVTSVARALRASGAENESLIVLDASWREGTDMQAGTGGMMEHALIAAQTRVDLGRYDEAQEALRSIELHRAPDGVWAGAVDLLRMKLALRMNSYSLVWRLSDKLLASAPDEAELQLERELIVNTAVRDHLDVDRMEASIDRLTAIRPDVDKLGQRKIDRSLARTLAKLGRSAAALDAANAAIESANEDDDLRGLGNAHLAMAEALRHGGHPEDAREHYRIGAEIGRGVGNRDSLLWCLLGDASALVQTGATAPALAVISDIVRLMDEPGYEHPIERAHAGLIAAAATLIDGGQVDIGEVMSPFERLGIGWPRAILDPLAATRKLSAPLPI